MYRLAKAMPFSVGLEKAIFSKDMLGVAYKNLARAASRSCDAIFCPRKSAWTHTTWTPMIAGTEVRHRSKLDSISGNAFRIGSTASMPIMWEFWTYKKVVRNRFLLSPSLELNPNSWCAILRIASAFWRTAIGSAARTCTLPMEKSSSSVWP